MKILKLIKKFKALFKPKEVDHYIRQKEIERLKREAFNKHFYQYPNYFL
ncbi:MAG: hypothetical protein H6626_05295 [Pseudobdellovibrionaceae bacterium]|nr:MAG: hypothetical protein H6626_05295 [Pseudobdellovibrionaceae bacterium]